MAPHTDIEALVNYIGKRSSFDFGLRKTPPRQPDLQSDTVEWLQHLRPTMGVFESDLVVPVILHLSDARTASFGRALSELDTDMRRVDAYLVRGDLRPHLNTRSTVVAAAFGRSIDGILAVGYEALLSNPVQFALTLNWFWEHKVQLLHSFARRKRHRAPEAQIVDEVADLFRAGASHVNVEYVEEPNGAKRFSLTASSTERIEAVTDQIQAGLGESLDLESPRLEEPRSLPNLWGPMDRLLRGLPRMRQVPKQPALEPGSD